MISTFANVKKAMRLRLDLVIPKLLLGGRQSGREYVQVCLQFKAFFCLPCFVAISESQHTRCAHRALPGLAGGSAPSTPCKGKRPKT